MVSLGRMGSPYWIPKSLSIPTMKIQIIDATEKIWYKDHIGETHNVIGVHDIMGYAVYEEEEGKVTKYVRIEHCKILEPVDDVPFFLRTQRYLEDSFPYKIYVMDRGIFTFHISYLKGVYTYEYVNHNKSTPDILISYSTMNINLTHKMLIELACLVKYKYKVHF